MQKRHARPCRYTRGLNCQFSAKSLGGRAAMLSHNGMLGGAEGAAASASTSIRHRRHTKRHLASAHVLAACRCKAGGTSSTHCPTWGAQPAKPTATQGGLFTSHGDYMVRRIGAPALHPRAVPNWAPGEAPAACIACLCLDAILGHTDWQGHGSGNLHQPNMHANWRAHTQGTAFGLRKLAIAA